MLYVLILENCPLYQGSRGSQNGREGLLFFLHHSDRTLQNLFLFFFYKGCLMRGMSLSSRLGSVNERMVSGVQRVVLDATNRKRAVTTAG